MPSVDILVNNLGVYEPKPFEKITDDDWHTIIETNFMSGVRLCRHYLPGMKAANWGRIIFISSESAVNIPVEMIHYGVTKTMQVALARGSGRNDIGHRCYSQFNSRRPDAVGRRRAIHRRCCKNEGDRT